jgi:hypothetical protein
MLLTAACGSPSGPDSGSKPAPIPRLEVEVRNLFASAPYPEYHAACQTGAFVLLKAERSEDPLGQPLRYEFADRVAGQLTADFGPGMNPMSLTEPLAPVGLYTIAVHDITLTVRARDGRKASTTVQVLVTACETCGG